MRNTNRKRTNYFFVILLLTIAVTAIASTWQVPNNVTKYDSIFESNGAKYGVDPILLKAQIAAESRFINVTTANKAGAVGIAQFTQATAQQWGLKDRTNVQESLDAQARYMAWLVNKFNGDYIKAIAGYNWGPNRKKLNTAESGNEIRNKMPLETRNYLKRIAEAYIAYGGKGTFLKFAQAILNGDTSNIKVDPGDSNTNSNSACDAADPSEFLSDSDGYGSLPEAPIGDYATMSPLEMILTEADRRFGSDAWSKKVIQVSSRALWLDYTKELAAENYLRRLNYEKRQNIEALLANLIAIRLENARLAALQTKAAAQQNNISKDIR